MILFLTSTVLAAILQFVTSQTVHRTSSAGKLVGLTQQILGKTIELYQSVPFAYPPLGDYRFRRPIPKRGWKGVLNATVAPNACTQIPDNAFGQFSGAQMWNPNTNVSEDCLYLNIWTPVTVTSSSGSAAKKAVLLWIYGGSFVSGSLALEVYNAAPIAAEGDVVVVSINYRVGPLGFYYLGTLDAPGNMGLMDQACAIQWVHDHIASFGGDPARITLFGESAGGISASLHLFSDMSKNLISHVILESGACLNSPTIRGPSILRDFSLQLANIVGCDSHQSVEKIVDCMKRMDPMVLMANTYSVRDDRVVPMPFAPTIDGHFLTTFPNESMAMGTNKKTSILLGVNQDEGSYFVMYETGVSNIFTLNTTPPTLTSAQFDTVVKTLTRDQTQSVTDTANFLYRTQVDFGLSPPGALNLSSGYAVIGDHLIACSTVGLGDAYASAGLPVYAYLFNHISSANPWPRWMGVMHGYEIDHVFGAPLVVGSYTASERDLSARMIRHLTNFAKTGDPNKNNDGTASLNYSWPVYNSDTKEYLILDVDAVSTAKGLLYQRCLFWNDLVPKLTSNFVP